MAEAVAASSGATRVEYILGVPLVVRVTDY
jgi:hypothetical protein